ncbi:beta-1,3-galactosyltransferase brn-like, partial [Paramacrobiotus metropolitanus]|uniref:beta-1,3-galactosyltransferase brn-like n=1 Tax=Paramacrobiotus metropolitanus TaxID=2943436 RepID=UPI00244583E1
PASNPLHLIQRLLCDSGLVQCDAYFSFSLTITILVCAHFLGVYDILLFESSFPSDFSWPPHVFDDASFETYQRNADGRKIDYPEFSSSLTSSFEEWKLNAAFWRLENANDYSDRPAFAPGMMSMVGQIPVIKTHIKYLQAITNPVDLPPPVACTTTEDAAKSLGLLIVVKSALAHFERRAAIRRTYAAAVHRRDAQRDFEVLFVLGVAGGNGVSGSGEFSWDLQERVVREQAEFGDLVQMRFVDTYFNNTAKTVAGIHYVVDNCPVLDPRHGFLFLTDDDMLVNVENLEKLIETVKVQREAEGIKDVYLGYKFPGSKPKRWRLSKWYVSTNEYPFSWYPPYITAAAVLLSKDTVEKFNYASHFVPLFRFDDIYLSILAHMMAVESQHYGDAFHFDHLPFDEKTYKFYRDTVVAVHGYHDPELLERTYDKLKKLMGRA